MFASTSFSLLKDHLCWPETTVYTFLSSFLESSAVHDQGKSVSNIPASSSVITRELLYDAIHTHLPWPPQEHEGSLATYIPNREFIRARCYPAIYKMSTMRAEDIVEAGMAALPDASDPDFPVQALGLIELFDQCPRMLLRGPEMRYAFSHFDTVANMIWHRLASLPPAQRPDSRGLWQRATGPEHANAYDYWILARLWFLGPLVHSESRHDHALLEVLSADVRAEMEHHSSLSDPYAEGREERYNDIMCFRRQAANGPPRGPDTTVPAFMFWCLDAFEAHSPIIRHFGRYPFRNRGVGRQAKSEEEEYLVATGRFGEIDPATADKICEDARNGVWTPLAPPAE